ncbi:uncharacterized protein ATC70_012796 [Mucor velutinosus]|uniref:BEACH domain-containing protein n=1 Tax=Mucor velutinosus TaxID=708070 RepID=A0AAN7HRB7_9FUNG|nr:hypothetical protein ATC70_012796 [Mucor velutinosus]
MLDSQHTVNTEQLNRFYSKNNKPQQHINYDYYKPDDFEQEINEFISYSEVKNELKQYQQEYNELFPPWSECLQDERRDIIQRCGDHLDLLNDQQRLRAAKRLAYISLGSYGEYAGLEKKQAHLQAIEKNNQMLFKMDILATIKQCLNHACKQLETPSISSVPDSVKFHCKEIDIHLTVFYLIVSFNQEGIQDAGLSEFLFDLVVRLKEHFTKTFPLKKLMLVLHKVLHISLGPLDASHQQLKSSIRTACHLPLIADKSTTVKCTPEELFQFYHQASERYPTFTHNDTPSQCTNPLTVTASTRLSKAMGLYKASKNIDLPYQTLFPSKNQQPTAATNMAVNGSSSSSSSSSSKKQQLAMETNLLPFTESSAMEPRSLTESKSVWIKHLYISVANYQIIYEREKAVHRWSRWSQRHQHPHTSEEEWDGMVYDHLDKQQQATVKRIDQLYQSIVPSFQSIVVIILKLLLSTVSIGKDKEAEILEDIDVTRNRESISKAVSGILLLLLKWFKTSHVLKFEYLSQVLIDSGCMLLILKLLGLQEVALLASKKTDDDSQSFLGFVQQTHANNDNDMDDDDNNDTQENYTNSRNLSWSINLLRILQMLTKRKTHRILLLVQYKSSAILKRLLKVGHPVMDLYVLKNLKNQVPFMGRKWRSANMKTISAIYAHCLTSLNDDWLSSPEGSADMDESAMKEINLRMLTRLYNGQRYLPNMLPSMDEVSGPDNTLFYSNDYTAATTANSHDSTSKALPDYTLNEPILVDDMELDMDFKRDYRNWLERDVYFTDGEDDEDEDEDDDDDDRDFDEEATAATTNGHIGTPLPDTIPIPLSAQDLTHEINKLYLEELRREFEEKQKKQELLEEQEKQLLLEQDGWGASPSSIQTTGGWGTPAVERKTFFDDDDDDDADEVEPEVNPLQDIDWGSLTAEELEKRLSLVEQKTVQRWLNVEMDDERYMKVLNTFEGEVLTDDEGWPI